MLIFLMIFKNFFFSYMGICSSQFCKQRQSHFFSTFHFFVFLFSFFFFWFIFFILCNSFIRSSWKKEVMASYHDRKTYFYGRDKQFTDY